MAAVFNYLFADGVVYVELRGVFCYESQLVYFQVMNPVLFVFDLFQYF
jgi:hypothetical protein